MGKTFKHGYMILQHSFNSHSRHRIDKKNYRQKKRNLTNSDFRILYYEYNYDSIYLSNKKYCIHKKYLLRKPPKIGYCFNTHNNLNDYSNIIYPKFTIGDNKLSREIPTSFKNFEEYKKINILIDEMENIENYYNYVKIGLINMKKQIKRRGKIGYFKGHYKINKNENENLYYI